MSDQQTPKFPLYRLDPQQLATVILALAYYQEHRAEEEKQGRVAVGSCHTAAFGSIEPLDSAKIRPLIDSLDHGGLDFSEIVPLFAESAEDSPYVRTAQELASEGKFEIDDPAVVSMGDDAGAYVMGWMWVSDAAAGVSDYFTIQLDDPIPEGGFVIGGFASGEPTWYFEDVDDQIMAADYARSLGLTYQTGIAATLPPDLEEPDELEDFQSHACDRVAQRSQR